MAHLSWGGVPTASEGCANATLPRPGTAGPVPARAEGAAPAAAAQLPTESSPGTPPGGRGPGKPGEGAVESWVPWVLPPLSPLPSPSQPSPHSPLHLLQGAAGCPVARQGLSSQDTAQNRWGQGGPGTARIPRPQAPTPQAVTRPLLHALEEGATGGGR